MSALTIRNVEIEGRPGLDVRIEAGRIAAVGPRLPATPDEIDAAGGALIPGLADHHIHLLALAAQSSSVDLRDVATRHQIFARLGAAAAARPPGVWLRAVGCPARVAETLTLADLDALAPRHPLRLQDQTGALWLLNGRALAALGDADLPPSVERDAAGRPTGRLFRGDAWLRERLGAEPPDLAAIGRRLASYGVTCVTDASANTDAASAALLAAAHRAGDLPQRLTLMSAGSLEAAADAAFAVGPVKVLLDDAALIDLDDFAQRIERARAWRRNVAVHCVTAAELALTLAAFDAAGARPQDRIEHGGVIPPEAISQIKALGLTVVTQPAFVAERGDRYLAEVDPAEQPDLYRCASLIAAGVPVALSSDAPYAQPDPWATIAAATRRRTASGASLGLAERIPAADALARSLGRPGDPAGPPRRVASGAPADLCLLGAPLAEVLADPSAAQVRATLIEGRIVFSAEARQA
jgi:predicted amidohydrolase YtcJ